MTDWLLSTAVVLALLAFPVRAGENDEAPVLDTLDMASLAKQGRVTRWWWDLHSPKITTLNDKTFDDFVAQKDFTMVEFFLPTCKHCNDFSTSYNRLATTITSERQDVQFARVNCGTDQSTRAPTAAEMEQGIQPGVYERAKGDETKYDGEIVCEWYNMKDLPALIFFRPGYENPKFVDAKELTHDDILEWTENEIAKIRKEQGHDEFYQGPGLPKVGSAEAASDTKETKFKSREDVLKFLNQEDAQKSCEDLEMENKKLQAENARLTQALNAVHKLVKDL